MEYNRIWVSRLIRGGIFKKIHPCLSSIFIFGLPQVFLAIFFLIYFDVFSKLDRVKIFSLALGALWVTLGPYLIYLYDVKLLPSFFQKIEDLLEDKKAINELCNKFNTFFSKKFYKFSIIWCLLSVFVFFCNSEFFEFYKIKYLSVAFFLIMIDVLWVGVLTSVGFWGVLTTIRAIRETSNDLRKINLFNIDLGGLSPFSNFAMSTTLLFATGTLFIPMVVDFVSRAYDFIFVLYLLLFFFIVSIILSYFIPIYFVYVRAKKIKGLELEKIGKEYELLMQKSELDLLSQVRILNLRNLYVDYKNTKIYPVEIDKIFKLASSIFIAIIISALKLFLFRGNP